MPQQLSLLGLLAMFGDTFFAHGEGPPPHYSQIYGPGDGYPKTRGARSRFKADDFDEEIHDTIRRMLDTEGVDGMVVFECQDMCSPHIGERRGLIFGPGCTFKTLDMALWRDHEGEKKILNRIDMELASTQKSPVGYYLKAEPLGVDDQAEECQRLKQAYWTEKHPPLEGGVRVFVKEGEPITIVDKTGRVHKMVEDPVDGKVPGEAAAANPQTD